MTEIRYGLGYEYGMVVTTDHCHHVTYAHHYSPCNPHDATTENRQYHYAYDGCGSMMTRMIWL